MRRSSLLAATLLSTALLGCVDAPDARDDGPACEGKCDGPGTGGPRPDEQVVQRLLAAAEADGTVDAVEAADLGAFAKAATGRNPRIAALLEGLAANDRKVSPDAAKVLLAAARGERPDDVPLANAVYKVVLGTSPFLEDDALYLVADGEVEGDTGLRSHSRGYAAKRAGVLFNRHGSMAPNHPATMTPDEIAKVRTQTPDLALDRAALLGGLKLSRYTTFSATAHSSTYYDTSSSTPDWAGICHGWTHNALDDRLSLLVDPPGNPGERGLWIYGQWLSRADLGNAMMAASYSLGIADSYTIDSLVKPDKLVKGLAQYVLRSGLGLRVDIWNDAHNASGTYNPQIWNQPVVAAGVKVSSVSAAASDAVLAYARNDRSSFTPVPADARVKLVQATASWGVEAGDSWEKEAQFEKSTWNMYMVTAADGRVVRAYMAFDLAAANVRNLPVTESDGLPDYMAVPKHELTDASLGGATHRLLDPANGDGARYRFMVGTVLAQGIPEPTRKAFEADAAAGVAGAVLKARYPGIANAYSPDQWSRAYGTKLGAGKDFGATWVTP